MAKGIIEHYRNFDPSKMGDFGEKVRLGIGLIVYGKVSKELEPKDVSVSSVVLGPGSFTGASSGTELIVDLAAEAWPLSESGERLGPEEAIERAQEISDRLGALLLGGVDGVDRQQVVNVWTRHHIATGWYDLERAVELNAPKDIE